MLLRSFKILAKPMSIRHNSDVDVGSAHPTNLGVLTASMAKKYRLIEFPVIVPKMSFPSLLYSWYYCLDIEFFL